jgi:hypothetical protein
MDWEELSDRIILDLLTNANILLTLQYQELQALKIFSLPYRMLEDKF